MVGLGDLPGGNFYSVTNAVSADGSVVVGKSTSASGNEAFLWTAGGGMVNLDDFPEGNFYKANAVSADGSVVVGSGDTAVVRGSENGIRDITTTLPVRESTCPRRGCSTR
jgi:probable HAF family extracellular repeat protein